MAWNKKAIFAKLFSVQVLSTIALPFLSIIITLFIAAQQISAQKQIEFIKNSLAQEDLALNKAGLAASLIDKLNGTEIERALAKVIISSMHDTALVSKIFAVIANNSHVGDILKIQAIHGIAITGKGHEALEVLHNISEKSIQHSADKIEAEQASKQVLLRTISAGDVLVKLQRWQPAADYYRQAIQHMPVDMNINQIRIAAESNFAHGNYEQAANQFKEVLDSIQMGR